MKKKNLMTALLLSLALSVFLLISCGPDEEEVTYDPQLPEVVKNYIRNYIKYLNEVPVPANTNYYDHYTKTDDDGGYIIRIVWTDADTSKYDDYLALWKARGAWSIRETSRAVTSTSSKELQLGADWDAAVYFFSDSGEMSGTDGWFVPANSIVLWIYAYGD